TEWVADGLVPVTVRTELELAALAATVTVSVELPPVVTEVGLNAAVTPAGKPVTARLIVSGLPLTTAVEIVYAPELPAATVSDEGLAVIEKSFVGGGGGGPPQPGNEKLPMRVLQLNVPSAFRYSLVNQKVQSSTGSTVIAL